MKIKIAISIIAIMISGISMAEAGPYHRYSHHYESTHWGHYGHPGHHYRKHHYRSHWKHERRHARQHRREQRHYRRHHYNRYERTHRYNSPRVSSSHKVVVRSHGHSNRALPIVAGGLIGSVIASDASHGDPAATFGGAVFGALVGNALSHH